MFARTLAALLFLTGTIVSAQAATVATVLAVDADAWAMVDTSESLVLGGGATWDPVRTPTSGSVSGDWRSPFDPEGTGETGLTDWDDIEYWTVGPSPASSANDPNPGVLKFSSAVSILYMLWGSPDTYNSLTFGNGDIVTGGSVLTQHLGLGGTAQRGASYVRIVTDTPFTEVSFLSSGANAFEVSNIAVPLPAAAPLFLGGMGLLGLVGRLRRRRRAEAAA